MIIDRGMQHSSRLAVIMITLLMGVQLCAADRGGIVGLKDVNIQEPAQRAIIAFNGFEEIIILQTDVVADRETKVVEFMPLPSKPKVSLANEGCFATLQDLLTKHNVRFIMQAKAAAANAVEEAEPVKVVISAQLGPHDLTVVELRKSDGFSRWVEDFFREKGLGQPVVTDDLSQLVDDYCGRSFYFFAFDVVTLSPQKTTVQPLSYEFKTDHLYYPLKVTNLYGGSDTIELFTLLPPGLCLNEHFDKVYYFGLKGSRNKWSKRLSTTATLAQEEMSKLHPSIPSLLGDSIGILQLTKMEGPTARFDRDGWIPWYYIDSKVLGQRFYNALQAGKLEVIERLVNVPFGFNRERTITDKHELMRKFAEHSQAGGLTKHGSLDTSVNPAESFTFENEDDRAFVHEQCQGQSRRIDVVEITADDERILVFVAYRRGSGVCHVVGFSYR